MRTKDQHLKLKGKTYYYVRDVPKDVRDQYGKSRIEVSLKTRDKTTARDRRNEKSKEIEREWHAIRTGRNARQADAGFVAQALMERTEGDDTPLLEGLANDIDDLASQFAKDRSAEALDAAREYVLEETEEGRKLQHRLDLYYGKVTYCQAGENYLKLKPELTDKTKNEYRRAYREADKNSLPQMDKLTPQRLKMFANHQGATKAKATVNKMLSAIRGLIEFNGIDVTALKSISANSVKSEIKRQVWKPEDLRKVLEASKSKWLSDVVLIGLYTGAREGAIADMSYDAENDWIVFPRQKQEADDRKLPCPDRIREARSQSSISSQFTVAKQKAGFTGAEFDNIYVFHSLRHMAASRLNDLGVPEHIAARIVGHKNQSMTFGRYGSKGEVEALREYIEKADWSDIFDKE